jgi:hypothetical protein
MSNYYPTLEKHSTSQRDQGPNGIRAGAAAGVADECALPFCQTRALRRVKTGRPYKSARQYAGRVV